MKAHRKHKEPTPESAPQEETMIENGIEAESERTEASNEFKEKYVRLLAEFTNYQRQKEEEIKSTLKYGNSSLLAKILEVVDDIDSGLGQEQVSEETKGILELLKSKLMHILTLEGVTEIELKEGDPYDPQCSEVITTMPSEDQKGLVIHVARKGYKLGERVLRTAKVVVGK